jgi:hypothetical protein
MSVLLLNMLAERKPSQGKIGQRVCLSMHKACIAKVTCVRGIGLFYIGICPVIALLHAQELLELSLSAPGRVPLPRAPPHSLLLFDNQFSPFPTGWGLETPLVSRFTGDRLQLREGGQQMRQEFRQKVRAGPNSACQ